MPNQRKIACENTAEYEFRLDRLSFSKRYALSSLNINANASSWESTAIASRKGHVSCNAKTTHHPRRVVSKIMSQPIQTNLGQCSELGGCCCCCCCYCCCSINEENKLLPAFSFRCRKKKIYAAPAIKCFIVEHPAGVRECFTILWLSSYPAKRVSESEIAYVHCAATASGAPAVRFFRGMQPDDVDGTNTQPPLNGCDRYQTRRQLMI